SPGVYAHVRRYATAARGASRSTLLIACVVVAAIACQNSGDGAIVTQPTEPSAQRMRSASEAPLLSLAPFGSGQIKMQFGAGATAASARATGHQFGLELAGGPMISGPLAPGFYVFQSPQVNVDAMTPTTARIYFPSNLTLSERQSFMTSNGLRFLKWLKPEKGFGVALATLPGANLQPILVDPV